MKEIHHLLGQTLLSDDILHKLDNTESLFARVLGKDAASLGATGLEK